MDIGEIIDFTLTKFSLNDYWNLVVSNPLAHFLAMAIGQKVYKGRFIGSDLFGVWLNENTIYIEVCGSTGFVELLGRIE